MFYFSHRLTILLPAILLSACLSSPVSTEVDTYALENVSTKQAGERSGAGTLLVSVSTLNPAYKTSHMIYIDQPYQLNIFAKNEWVSSPAEMLLPLLAESLRNTRHFHAVVTPPFSGRSDFFLVVKLAKLQQNFLHKPSAIEMELQADLIDQELGVVVDSQRFETTIAAPEDTPQGGVVAANIATEQLLEQIAVFAAKA